MALMFAIAVAAATADPNCGPTKDVYEYLSEQRHEERKGYGVTEQGGIVEFWTGPDSWTTFVTMPNGVSCLIANGTDWGYGPVKKEPDL